MSNMHTKPLIEPPPSDSERKYETLAYVAAYDAVLNCDYAFVAYKEIDRGGDWRIRIKSSQTAGGVFEPVIIRKQARGAAGHGKTSFQWGYSFDPSPGDPRTIQFRVHLKDGQPNEVEIFVQLRQYDGAADVSHSVKFAWPRG